MDESDWDQSFDIFKDKFTFLTKLIYYLNIHIWIKYKN